MIYILTQNFGDFFCKLKGVAVLFAKDLVCFVDAQHQVFRHKTSLNCFNYELLDSRNKIFYLTLLLSLLQYMRLKLHQ
jgi:hypothetical protein